MHIIAEILWQIKFLNMVLYFMPHSGQKQQFPKTLIFQYFGLFKLKKQSMYLKLIIF